MLTVDARVPESLIGRFDLFGRMDRGWSRDGNQLGLGLAIDCNRKPLSRFNLPNKFGEPRLCLENSNRSHSLLRQLSVIIN
jgi:hypothetical protein